MEFPSSSSSSAAAAARASMAEKSRRHLYGDADAQAALLLRHRLFPRAMAWNATQQQQQQQQPHVHPHQQQQQQQQQQDLRRQQQHQQPEQVLRQQQEFQIQQQQQQTEDWRWRRESNEYAARFDYQERREQQQHADMRMSARRSVQSANGSSSSTSQQRPNVQQQQQRSYQNQNQNLQSLDVAGAFTAQLHAFHLNDRSPVAPPAPATQRPAGMMSEVPPQAVHEAMNFARSFPLLHATSVAENTMRRQKENVGVHSNIMASNNHSISNQSTSSNNNTNSNPFLTGAPPTQDAREKLFRTMGKWFDGSAGSAGNSANNSRSSLASSTGSGATGEDGALLQHIPRKANFDHVAPPPPISISFASTTTTSNTSFGHSFSPVQALSGSYSADTSPVTTTTSIDTSTSLRRVNLVIQDPIFDTPKSASFSGMPPSLYAESRGTPSPTNSTSNWSVSSEPRLRSPPRNPAGSLSSSGYGKKRHRSTPAPSLAKALLTGCGAKRCSFEDCGKIAVSKGLCRGHGGGRRCQFTGCTKCAQSRSPYCWAHGGGKRCEAPNCRRSRKTKHYCVDHVDMEASVSLSGAADSDESMDGPSSSTAASDVDMAVISSEKRSGSEVQTQRQQKATSKKAATTKSNAGRAKLALQLPSLNDALKRPFPSPDVFQQQQQQMGVAVQRKQQVQQFNFELPKPSSSP